MKILSNKKIYFILLFGALFLPFAFVLASDVYIDTEHQDLFVGDTILFSVRVDSENKNINVVEGSVLLDYAKESASLIDINTAGTEFSLWPGKPLPSEDNTSISFTGGVPGGLNSKDALIFNIVLKLQKAGRIALTPNNFSVYLNDGKGTKDEVRVTSLVIDVLPLKLDSRPRDDWDNLISDDTVPPEFIEAVVSRDSYVFDNQYFVSFFAVDDISGIAYYEIKEGGRDFIRAESPYLLQDQSLKSIIHIKAVDKAGNETVISPDLSIPSEIPKVEYLIITLILIGVVLGAIIMRRYVLNKKSK